MPVTCDLVHRAIEGLQGGVQSPMAARALAALNALAAADIGVRLGSRGQAGIADLPGLLNQRGIECYSPELGDSIWVSPLQWFANGMSCDGLRDPNREELQKKIEDAERRIRERRRIQNSSDLLPDLDLPPDVVRPPKSFKKNSENVNFVGFGTLIVTIEKATNYLFQGQEFFSRQTYTQQYNIKPGDRLQYLSGQTGRTATFESLTYWRVNLLADRTYETSGGRYVNILPGGLPGGRDLRTIDFSVGSYQFIPRSDSPPLYTFFDPPLLEHSRKKNPEEICDMGCACNQINRIVQQQRQTDASLRRLIEEIHKAVAANFFNSSAAQFFKPEQRIEQAGRQIYTNPGREGRIPVSNLLDSTAALIAAEYHRLGLHKFPASVPKDLIPNPNAALEAIDRDFIKLHTLADYLEWSTKIDDERLGQWPIEFEVTDDNKKKKVYLWNVAEALGDIYGALIKVVEDSDVGVQWGIRSAVEASKAGNASVKALHLLKELVQFSGALTEENIKTIDSTFTPDPLVAQSAEDMLKPSKQDLTVTDIVDKRSLLGLLLNISYWVQIAGRSVYGDLTNNPATRQPNMPGDSIRQMKRRSRVLDKRWDEWRRKRQQRRNISLSDQPPGGLHPPDIRDISPQQ